MLDLAATNLLSPAVLCFALGAAAVFLRSDLRLPEPVFAALSIYLMLAIGMKGGVELSERPLGELAAPMAAGLLLGCLIPLTSFVLLRRFAGLSIPDAAAMAAHYGSVSAVTFAAVTAFLDAQQVPYEGHVAALLAVMEIPAIVVAIALAQMPMLVSASYAGGGGAALSLRQGAAPSEGLAGVISNAMASKSVVLLGGGLAIGVLIGPTGMTKVKPLFVDLFPGLLCLFLLELGRLAASRIGDFRQVGLKLAVFAIVMPVVHAMLGITLGEAIGLSMGGAVVLGTLAASASYIAAPAAVRLALPEANPSYYLTCSLALTFPFNIVVGLPLYSAFAGWLYA